MFQALRVHADYRGQKVASALSAAVKAHMAVHCPATKRVRVTTLGDNDTSVSMHIKQVESSCCVPVQVYRITACLCGSMC